MSKLLSVLSNARFQAENNKMNKESKNITKKDLLKAPESVEAFVVNRPFPSSHLPLFHSEVKCKALDMKMSFICKNENSFSYERFCT